MDLLVMIYVVHGTHGFLLAARVFFLDRMTEELFFHNGLAFATQNLDSKDRFLLATRV